MGDFRVSLSVTPLWGTTLNVVLIAATMPGEMCGVTDYTVRLAAALRGIGIDAVVEFFDRWSFANFMKLKHRYRKNPNAIFHVQYPTLRLGLSVAPGFAPLLVGNSFVTLHEFGTFNVLRKAAFIPSSILSKKIIFSNNEEKARFQRYFPHSHGRLTVMPIGNNIPQLSPRGARVGPERLVYFGQISRNKGVEFFLDTVAQLRSAGASIDVDMIGAMVDSDRDFVDLVRSRSERDKIGLRLSLPADEVSATLNDATIALLPFPDGVSNKRGSALASLEHGATVLTTHSELTPEWLTKVTHPVSSPDNAADLIGRIMAGTAERVLAPETLARELRLRDWAEIARSHVKLYNAKLGDPIATGGAVLDASSPGTKR